MSMGRSWTTKKAERVWKQLRGGMNVNTIASMHGCTATNIHRRLRTAGYDPHGANMAENVQNNHAGLIYARRRAGAEFNEIAVELGMEPTPGNMRRLYMRLVRYCERAEVPYPHQPKRRKERVDQTAAFRSDDVVHRAVEALKKTSVPGGVVDYAAFREAMGIDARRLKTIIAELRRRHILADGLVVMPFEISPPVNAGSETAVLHAIVEAWDGDGPCASLNTLVQSLGYSRSTVNIAIIKLRSLNLVYPRGTLVRRKDAR
jgi:hypothetical protein